MIKLLLITIALNSQGKTGNWPLTVGPFTRYKVFTASQLGSGPTAPTGQIIGTYFGIGFDDANDEALLKFESPDDWTGTSDMVLRIYWTNEAGTAIPNTKKVIWQPTYRCVSTSSGVLTAGTIAIPTAATYTQSGAGVDGELHISTITLDREHATQPTTKDFLCGISIKRDTATESTNTYSADAVILYTEISMSVNDFTIHN